LYFYKPEGLSGGFLNAFADCADVPAESADCAATRAEERCESGRKRENGNVFQ
jgi:hypothetical protein